VTRRGSGGWWLAVGFGLPWALGCPGGSTSADADAEAAGDVPDVAEDDGGRFDDAADGAEDGGEGPPPIEFPPACGDGTVDPGEDCDDGNRLNGDTCDWRCRFGPGDFTYPDPDPTLPAIVPDTPVEPATGVDEVTPYHLLNTDSICVGPIALAWTGSRFALFYPANVPAPSLRIAWLDRTGHSVAPRWEQEADLAWTFSTPHLLRWGERAILLTSLRSGGLLRTRFDASGAPEELFYRVSWPDWPEHMEDSFLSAGAAVDGDRAVLVRRYLTCGTDGPPLPPACASWFLDRVALDGDGVESVAATTGLGAGACGGVAVTAAGYLVWDGSHLAALDRELHPLGSAGGLLADGELSAGAGRIVGIGGGALVFWAQDAETGGTAIKAACVDASGALSCPPREVVVVPSMRFEPSLIEPPFFDVASGPAGAAVVYREAESDTGPSRIRVLTVDLWTKVITPPLDQFPGAGTTLLPTALAIAADDTGYGVAGADQGDGTPDTLVRIVFRHFAPAP
jgi:cysteine-rich repeat protein